MVIEYNENIRKDLREPLEAVINKYRILLPVWLQKLVVNMWDTPNDGEVANVHTMHEYRTATLNTNASWLSQSDYERELTIIHELLHICLDPMDVYPQNVFDQLLEHDAPNYHATVKDEYRAKVEGVVQDMTVMIYNIINKPTGGQVIPLYGIPHDMSIQEFVDSVPNIKLANK